MAKSVVGVDTDASLTHPQEQQLTPMSWTAALVWETQPQTAALNLKGSPGLSPNLPSFLT